MTANTAPDAKSCTALVRLAGVILKAASAQPDRMTATGKAE
jgi:hypothetical protein